MCHCGENISATVDCPAVAAAAAKMRGVVHAVDYKYMCSQPGQDMLKQAVAEHRLSGVVVAACSPRMHEPTFRRAAAEAGINPYRCEMANIREQCSWVHDDRSEATRKAIDLVRLMAAKVRRNDDLHPIRVPVTHRALVIGGGIAGIQAALDIANAGHQVVLVEREPSIGGHMAQLSETFPTLDCSQCILTPRMVEVASHPNIKLLVSSEVESVAGVIGNFEATIRRKATSINGAICTGCGACTQVCPLNGKIVSDFDCGLGARGAIYVPFPQAVPNRPVIDRVRCLRFRSAQKQGVSPAESTVCGKCLDACPIEPQKAIDFAQQDEILTERVGAIVVATGFDIYTCGRPDPNSSREGYGEYGYDDYADVITGLQFERLASASGPTGGRILRPSDGTEPRTVVFIKCVGSRDNAKGFTYCSKVCCMYTAKHAMLYRHKVHAGRAIVFYMDIRSPGKGFDEFVRRAIEEDDATYIRGRVSRIYREGGKLIVQGADTLSGEQVEVEADMVVLATAMMRSTGAEDLARMLGVSYDKDGWLSEAHPKLRPVETATAGVFLAGACQGPKDIPETVAQAGAAASKVLGLFSAAELEREPIVARVNRRPPPEFSTCIGCGFCVNACPFNAIEIEEITDKAGNVVKRAARVLEAACQGCGTCISVCRSNSIELSGFNDEQLFAQIDAL